MQSFIEIKGIVEQGSFEKDKHGNLLKDSKIAQKFPVKSKFTPNLVPTIPEFLTILVHDSDFQEQESNWSSLNQIFALRSVKEQAQHSQNYSWVRSREWCKLRSQFLQLKYI
jgi:hypothetical protein